jgi:hypothetical protein
MSWLTTSRRSAALRLFCQYRLERVDLQVALGQQFLEADVLIGQAFELFGVVDGHALMAPAPTIEGDFRDAMLATHLRDGRGARFGLLKNGDDLLGGEHSIIGSLVAGLP